MTPAVHWPRPFVLEPIISVTGNVAVSRVIVRMRKAAVAVSKRIFASSVQVLGQFFFSSSLGQFFAICLSGRAGKIILDFSR